MIMRAVFAATVAHLMINQRLHFRVMTEYFQRCRQASCFRLIATMSA